METRLYGAFGKGGREASGSPGLSHASTATHRALGFALTLGCLAGCEDDPWLLGVGATAEATAVELTPQEGGAATVEATVLLHLEALGDQEIALDAVRVYLDAVEVPVEVSVDDEDWPVGLDDGERADREIRVVARADQLPQLVPGPCLQPVYFEASVDLLVTAGAASATVPPRELSLGVLGPRIELTRSSSEIDLGLREPTYLWPTATVDGEGSVWVVVRDRYETTGVLRSRAADGSQESLFVPVGASVAPATDGGVFLVSPDLGRAKVSLRRRGGDIAWERELRSEAFTPDQLVPFAAAAGRIVLALPGFGPLEVEGESPTSGVGGTVLVELDVDGAVVAIDEVAIEGAYNVAVSAEATAVASQHPAGQVALVKEGAVLWQYPAYGNALAFGPKGLLVATADRQLVQLDALGAVTWAAQFLFAWTPASLAVRADGEVLVGSPEGTAARVGPDGAIRFEGGVSCSGPVSFGGSEGRVAYAAIFGDREGWVDGADREVVSTTLSFGEVLP